MCVLDELRISVTEVLAHTPLTRRCERGQSSFTPAALSKTMDGIDVYALKVPKNMFTQRIHAFACPWIVNVAIAL